MRITQFKPALFLLLFLGITGFSIASRSPGIWLLGCCGVGLNGWLVLTGRFKPLPRLLANLITLASMFFVARQFFSPIGGPAASPVMTIGQFLVILQVVKLWEQRANRDYGQLLVLSLLLMVAASINTSSLLFGILLLLYLFLSLYCCLLFHLKVETDKAMAAYPLPEEKVSPAVLRQDQRFLARSMRRLSVVTATGSILTAVVVFLVFPRGSGQSFLAPSQSRAGQSMTGFVDELNFNQVARIQQNDRIMGYTSVTKNGRPMGPGDTIYFRGVTMDRYRGAAVEPLGGIGRRTLGRGGFARDARDYAPSNVSRYTAYAPREVTFLTASTPPAAAVTYEQKTSLSPTGTRAIFVVSGSGTPGERVSTARSFTPHRDVSTMPGTDLSLQTEDPLSSAIEYDVTSDDAANPRDFNQARFPTRFPADFSLLEPADIVHPTTSEIVPSLRATSRVYGPMYLRCFGFRDGDYIIEAGGVKLGDVASTQRVSVLLDAYMAGKPIVAVRSNRLITLPYVHPDIEAYARRVDVSGVDDAGRPLAAQREKLGGPSAVDEEIAANIARHLRNEFSYTLDISDSESRREADPILWFLSKDGRRGHCEYFAAAMSLLCQSVGVNARVALGFKCDEFNPYSNQFVIRQAHAHAWVEVLTPTGWVTFDPTSARDVDNQPHEYGLYQQIKHMLNWLEFSYANNVIAYDNDSREGLIQAIETEMTRPLYRGVNEGWLTRKLSDSTLYRAITDPDSALVRWVIIVVALIAAAMALRWAIRRWLLRRRAARIGLAALPHDEQLRLARQLGFYDDLLRILERRKIDRPAHLTPLEFSRSLLFLPHSAYRSIRRLTEVFYRVRYGQQDLSAGLQRRLQKVIQRLDQDLDATPG
ncbi:transglutaminase TgpA family protein [Humisphaera borealis]|uniref:DUF3488 domain-containing protein n=1 Tax=Humisphaera borealis TaxID=2807512 RepID=A0A7M2X2A7_9BACT|nr:DUF3488 and transglutaminase-like domain-containing protein [Humisphaera borealis]QOV91191.1 DUF3488 domain-containing protein [Humisphaera borealis]